MKITREEFKEYVSLYQEAWDDFNTYDDVINENCLDELLFPMFNWMDEKLGINKYRDWWTLWDIFTPHGRGVPIEWEEIQVGEDEFEVCNEVCSKDLDLIYDKWIKDNNE